MEKRSLIDAFEDNELKISMLYGIYAEKLPQHKDFWLQLSKEEVNHAKDIAKTFSGIKGDFEETNFTRGIVNLVSGYVEEKIAEAKKNSVTHIEALRTAIRIEESLLEKKCFDMFILKDITVKNLMERLSQDTNRHAQQLKEELKKLN